MPVSETGNNCNVFVMFSDITRKLRYVQCGHQRIKSSVDSLSYQNIALQQSFQNSLLEAGPHWLSISRFDIFTFKLIKKLTNFTRKSDLVQRTARDGTWRHTRAPRHHVRRVGGPDHRVSHGGAWPAGGRQVRGRKLQGCGGEWAG